MLVVDWWMDEWSSGIILGIDWCSYLIALVSSSPIFVRTSILFFHFSFFSLFRFFSFPLVVCAPFFLVCFSFFVFSFCSVFLYFFSLKHPCSPMMAKRKVTLAFLHIALYIRTAVISLLFVFVLYSHCGLFFSVD